jgi:hypothetical protein
MDALIVVFFFDNGCDLEPRKGSTGSSQLCWRRREKHTKNGFPIRYSNFVDTGTDTAEESDWQIDAST